MRKFFVYILVNFAFGFAPALAQNCEFDLQEGNSYVFVCSSLKTGQKGSICVGPESRCRDVIFPQGISSWPKPTSGEKFAIFKIGDPTNSHATFHVVEGRSNHRFGVEKILLVLVGGVTTFIGAVGMRLTTGRAEYIQDQRKKVRTWRDSLISTMRSFEQNSKEFKLPEYPHGLSSRNVRRILLCESFVKQKINEAKVGKISLSDAVRQSVEKVLSERA